MAGMTIYDEMNGHIESSHRKFEVSHSPNPNTIAAQKYFNSPCHQDAPSLNLNHDDYTSNHGASPDPLGTSMSTHKFGMQKRNYLSGNVDAQDLGNSPTQCLNNTSNTLQHYSSQNNMRNLLSSPTSAGNPGRNTSSGTLITKAMLEEIMKANLRKVGEQKKMAKEQEHLKELEKEHKTEQLGKFNQKIRKMNLKSARKKNKLELERTTSKPNRLNHKIEEKILASQKGNPTKTQRRRDIGLEFLNSMETERVKMLLQANAEKIRQNLSADDHQQLMTQMNLGNFSKANLAKQISQTQILGSNNSNFAGSNSKKQQKLLIGNHQFSKKKIKNKESGSYTSYNNVPQVQPHGNFNKRKDIMMRRIIQFEQIQNTQ
jgi:hypothetical protein